MADDTGDTPRSLHLKHLGDMTNRELEQFLEEKRAKRDAIVSGFEQQEHKAKSRGLPDRRVDVSKEIEKAQKNIGTSDRALAQLENRIRNIQTSRMLDGDSDFQDEEYGLNESEGSEGTPG